jgi:uncharacterized repeat protein (TIGR03803 family)
MSHSRLSSKLSARNCLPFVTAAMLLAGTFNLSPAQTLTVLHTFTGFPNDGANAAAGVIADGHGNLYGTTETGGPNNRGTVFELTPSGVESILYSFPNPSSLPNQIPSGAAPQATLVFDPQGNIYGTTQGGGRDTVYCFYACGTVFKITPTGRGKVFYGFSGPDGQGPLGGLTLDAQGNLYGTTTLGGGPIGAGSVFKLTPSGVETVLIGFSGGDGAIPAGNLAIDAKGNIYGTTQQGGASGSGVVFELSPDGTETILYNFAGPDGSYPNGVISDAQGNLYGTTSFGGAYGSGVVFKLTPEGVETVLHSFAGSPSDGASPTPGLAMDAKGNLYGTTSVGGPYSGIDNAGTGTIFKIAANGTETVLYSFCPTNGCADGQNPFGGLLLDTEGNLYGTTFYGGEPNCDPNRGCGVVFKLTP